MGQGAAAATALPGAWALLLANTAVLAAWTLGLTIGVPLLVAELAATGKGGLGMLAFVMGAYGAGDFVSNVLVAARAPALPWRFMFAGYLVLGSGLALLATASAVVPGAARVPVMMVLAFGAGLGGPMFFLPMMTRLQVNLAGADLAGVVRLRMALTSAAMVAGAALGPWLFRVFGAAITVGGCGVLIACTGLVGAAARDPLSLTAAVKRP